MKPFDINYRSAEKFFQDYLQLKDGKLFVVTEDPFSPKTQLAVNISVPRIDYAFQLNGTVLKIRDRKTAEKLEKPPGMLIQFQKDMEGFFKNLDQKLLVDEKYQFLLALCETIKDAETIIGEDIDEAPAEAEVTMRIYDRQGRAVRTLIDCETLLRTSYTWDGRSDGGRRLPIGIYILYLEAAGSKSVKKPIVIAH